MDPPPLRLPIQNFFKQFQMGKIPDLFKDFAFMHTIIFQMQKRIMPTIFIIYDDETISMHSFEGSVKTTVYRKFYEVAKRVKPDGIQKVLYVAEMVSYPNEVIQNPGFINMDSNERSTLERSGILSLFMLSKDLSHKMISLETDKIDDMKYVIGILHKPAEFSGYFRFLNSVISEFEKINAANQD